MRFNRVRLSGFKSFVEPAELAIGAGLTGIVGPNGCGKSNLVEALRWVMGETSAKQMRGAEMDSVIFGGTADRPARNQAEVALALDNTMRDAPAPFNDGDESATRARSTGSTARRCASATCSTCSPTSRPGRARPQSWRRGGSPP